MKNLQIRTINALSNQPLYTENLRETIVFLRHESDKIKVYNKEQIEVEIIDNGETIFLGTKTELFELLRKNKEEVTESIEEETKETHEKLREILIDYNSPEFGDCIVDDICNLFNFPTTIEEEEEEEEETKDLFEFYEEQPEAVSSILKQYEDLEEMTYEELAGLQKNLETIGYTFDYGLDAQPFNLRKI